MELWFWMSSYFLINITTTRGLQLTYLGWMNPCLWWSIFSPNVCTFTLKFLCFVQVDLFFLLSTYQLLKLLSLVQVFFWIGFYPNISMSCYSCFFRLCEIDHFNVLHTCKIFSFNRGGSSLKFILSDERLFS